MTSTLKRTFSQRKTKLYEDIEYSCTIRFLDDSDPLTVTYQKDQKGQSLIDHVCKELDLEEKDYFGLRFVDTEKQRHWLDPLKPVYKQLKLVTPSVLCFRVKFYPTEPIKLKEELTRYFLFLQLKRDLHHGRLLCLLADANLLAAYIVQSECGDYDPEEHQPGYVSKHKMLPKQTAKQEEKIAEIHKTLIDQTPADAEANFITKAASLDTYGVDPHPVKSSTLDPPVEGAKQRASPLFSKPLSRSRRNRFNRDQKGNQMYLGVTHLGIVTFQGNKRTHLFKWAQISKIAFEGKMFIVHVTISEWSSTIDMKPRPEDTENSALIKKRGLGTLGCTASGLKKHACGFKCATFSACKHLWKCAKEQQYFFTLDKATDAPKVTSGGGFFSRGTKFRFSGRCQKEVFQESSKISRIEPRFIRSPSNPAIMRSYNKSRCDSLPTKLKERSLNDSNSTFEKKRTPALSTGNIKKHVENHVEPVENQIEPVENQIEPVENRVELVENRDEPVANRVEPVENRVELVENWVEPVANRFEPVENQVAPIKPVYNQVEPVANRVEYVNHVLNTPSRVSTDSSMQSLTHGEIDFDHPNGNVSKELHNTLPRQKPVQVSDNPYEPMRSPSREDLPVEPIEPIPESESELELPNGEALVKNLAQELGETEHKPPQEATEEALVAEHIVPVSQAPNNETPIASTEWADDDEQTSVMTSQPSVSSQPAATNQPDTETSQQPENQPSEDGTDSPSTQPSPQEVAAATTQPPATPMYEQGLRCCKILTWTFLLMFTVMSIVAIFVLESELDMPVLRDIRQMPEVQDFKHQHYNPFKTTAAQKMGKWFK